MLKGPMNIYVCINVYHSLLSLEQIEQKQKYAIWKAAEIRKALKEGRKPEAGPPGGDKDEAPVNTTTISQVTIPTH
jgi:hypothetical protein